MEKTRSCAKCGSSEILRIPGSVGAFGSGNNIQLGATLFSSVKVTRYLCGDCGFLEEWVESADLQKLRDKYGR